MLGGNPLFSLLGMLVVIVAILVLAWWATKQIAQRPSLQSFAGRAANDDFRVLAQTSLGRDQRLVVAECGSRYFLLGVTEHSVSLVAELSEEEALRWKPGAAETVPTGRQSFATLLQNKMRR